MSISIKEIKELQDKINKSSLKQIKTIFQKQPFSTLEKLREYFDDIYYNTGETGISDEKYDILKDILLERNEDQKDIIGAKLREGENRVKLPFWLGSMDKLKGNEQDKIERWVKKNPSNNGYFITEKLDGVSCLLMWDKEDLNLYTRGDGKIGADISYLKSYLNFIPKKFSSPINVRGELIISKKNWEKYSSQFSNPRQLVSGLINSKTAREGLKDVDFIAYEIVGGKEMPTISEQFKTLNKLGFKTATSVKLNEINSEVLIETLTTFKADSEYNIDGIIVQTNVEYLRNTSGNPGYAFAFKMMTDENIFPTKVIEVEWNISKRGILKPRVNVDAVNIDGVVIRYATGFNGKYIFENGIGPGAIINITRSGDVIPFIVGVIKKVQPQMPEEDWKWNETKVDILPVELDPKSFCAKVILDFFKIFGVANVSEGTINKFMENGLNTLLKILKASKQDFSKIEGLGEKSAEKIWNNIHSSLKEVTLPKLMASSSLFGFGFGLKKFESLLGEVPNLLSLDEDEMREKIKNSKGFSDKTADKIIENLPSFLVFLDEISPFITFKKEKTKKKITDINLKVVFSGFRNAQLEEEIQNKGGEVTSAVSGKTTHLVVKDKNESSTKIEKAKKAGIPVMEEEEFKKFLNKI
jgi:NAD-dependent DNA ligase